MTDREALTRIYQSQTVKLRRLESKLIREPFRASELKEEITRQKGIVHGIGMSIGALGKLSQTSFEDLKSVEAATT